MIKEQTECKSVNITEEQKSLIFKAQQSQLVFQELKSDQAALSVNTTCVQVSRLNKSSLDF